LSKKEKKPTAPQPDEAPEIQETLSAPEEAAPETPEGPTEVESLQQTIAQQEDKFLRLCAEYDNFRKRTQKEKDAIYADATAAAVSALLPVYDNLERALKQDTADEAYKKGVEMTMTGLLKALEGLGVTQIDAAGQSFDPNIHNAVMHVEDETLGENTVAEVFQSGFLLGEKVIRFAMVKVAN
jgi:molecular chaperone GrpE